MKIEMKDALSWQAVYQDLQNEKLDIKTAYKLSKINKALEEEILFYQTKMQELFQEYGQKNEDGSLVLTEDGQGVKLIEETMNECYGKVEELYGLEVEIPDVELTLENLEGVTLSPAQITALLPLLGE